MGFFLGAGSSCAFGLPSIATLTDEVQGKLDDSAKELYQKAVTDIESLKPGKKPTDEDILNY